MTTLIILGIGAMAVLFVVARSVAIRRFERDLRLLTLENEPRSFGGPPTYDW